MKYIVYQTINLINNKIYIGVHQTSNPDIFDGYLGCGVSLDEPSIYMNPKTPFQYAVKKYGIKSFTRTVLKVFDNADDAYKLEAELVDVDFIKRKDTYNIALGGNKGNYSKTYIYKYSLNGNLLNSYESVTEAAKANNSQEKTIYRAIQMNIKVNDCYYSFTLTDKFIPKRQPNLKGKTVYIYDLNGNYLTEILSGKKLQEYYKIKSYTCLKQALMTGKPYKGTQISLEKVDKLPKAKESENKAKKIGCYDLNGNLIEKFDSIKEATRKYGSKVFRVLNKRQKKTNNLVFKYL